MMELLTFGSLYQMQTRAVYLEYKWPNRLMWRVFLCCMYPTLELYSLCLWTELPAV